MITFFFRYRYFFRNYHYKFFIFRNFLRRKRDFYYEKIFNKNFLNFFFASNFLFIFNNANSFDHFLFSR